jgi:hypothetical protein
VTPKDRNGLTEACADENLMLIFGCRNFERETIYTRINFGTTNRIQTSYFAQNNIRFVALVVSVLATGPKVCGFNPGRGGWIFKGDKNP